jgi:dipeptidase E
MKLILGGGGSGKQTVLSNKLFDEIIDNSKPILYIPLAWKDKTFAGCLEWLAGELASVEKAGMKMIASAKELADEDLLKYAAIREHARVRDFTAGSFLFRASPPRFSSVSG